jgi:hypothetical protein
MLHAMMLEVLRDNIVIMFLDEFSNSQYSYRYKYQLFSSSRPLVYKNTTETALVVLWLACSPRVWKIVCFNFQLDGDEVCLILDQHAKLYFIVLAH